MNTEKSNSTGASSGRPIYKIAWPLAALALAACWALGAESPPQKEQGSSLITDSTSLSVGWSLAVPDEVLLVTGLRIEEDLRFPEDFRSLSRRRYLRPEKPEELHVTITTSDGRKWTAKWEEKK